MTIIVPIAEPGVPDTVSILTLELVVRTAQHRRLNVRLGFVAAAWPRVGATLLLVTAVATVSHIVALPPERDALLRLAL